MAKCEKILISTASGLRMKNYLKIQKADLHRHLDGSLRASTLIELAEKFDVRVPDDFRFAPHMTLDKALGFFDTSLKLLQETKELTRVAGELCEDAAEENVVHLEVRFGPHLHQQKGLQLEEVIDSVLLGLDGKAGLILCGLYGDDPLLIKKFVEIARTRPGVVGLDLAGGPHSTQKFKLADYKEAFTLAREYGVNRTVHASEGRSPEEILTAIRELHAQRLGHATTLLESTEALECVLENNITIESCPTSNLQCGVIPSHQEHPLAKWLELGVKACINTDNTYFSNITLSEEYEKAKQINGITEELLSKSLQNGFDGAFSRI